MLFIHFCGNTTNEDPQKNLRKVDERKVMCELLEAARKAQGNISYYEVAKRLGISTPLLNRWKNNKGNPNGIHSLKLADMAGLTTREAIELIEGGFAEVSLLIMIATCSTLVYISDYLLISVYIMLNCGFNYFGSYFKFTHPIMGRCYCTD